MKSIKRNTILLSLVVFILLAGCAGEATQVGPAPTASPVVIMDGLNRAIQFDTSAQKIISIAPSNTEILFAVGAGSQVIARDEFSDYPQEVQALPSVGGGFGQLDVEKMISLQPDLVLASQLTPADQVESLEKVGLKVYLLPNPIDLEGMYANLVTVGQITGRAKEAQDLVEELKARVAAVDEKLAAAQTRPLVFYELDGTDPNAPWTAGPGSFIDTLIARAGGENLGGRLSDAYAQISVEQILVDNPAIVLLGDFTWGGVTVEDVLGRESWRELQAVKTGKIYTFDDNLVSRPGPRLVEGLEQLVRLLHPELFE